MSLLFGVTPTDPLTLTLVTLLLLAVATFSGWLPARGDFDPEHKRA